MKQRITFIANDEIDRLLGYCKKEIFYNKNQSEMIRHIIAVGIAVDREQKNYKKV